MKKGEGMDLIRALKIALGADEIKLSGNLNSKIQKMNWEQAKESGDAWFERTPTIIDIFKQGVAIGRVAKRRPIFILKYNNNQYVAFIGTEADVVRRLETRFEELGISETAA
jgi:hypothetical protein